MEIQCLIFDLDGTLVDSEGLCNQAFLDLLPALGDSVHSLVQRYRGVKMANILADLERRLQTTLPADFESRYRQHVSTLFAAHLKPMPGVFQMLSALPHRYCIASSGPMPKIRQSLQVSGLARYFDENVFSSYEVKSWKPDPGLFLHAAGTMGVPPEHCVVVEDSDVGIAAGVAAGMRTLRYAPAPVSGAPPADGSFSDMLALTRLLERMATRA